MIVETTTITKHCDCCGNETDAFAESNIGMFSNLVTRIDYEVHYAGTKTYSEFCSSCANEITKFFMSLKRKNL